jgi:hypothetical protein
MTHQLSCLPGTEVTTLSRAEDSANARDGSVDAYAIAICMCAFTETRANDQRRQRLTITTRRKPDRQLRAQTHHLAASQRMTSERTSL